MNPNTITGFLERNFCSEDIGIWNSPRYYQDFDAVIILYAYFDPSIGAHYVAGINNGNGIYTFYNDQSIGSVKLEDLYGKFEKYGELFIAGWGINFNN